MGVTQLGVTVADFAMDAEGFEEGVECPACGSRDTITFRYREGFEEYECPRCGYRSDAEELDSLMRYDGTLLEADEDARTVPIPRRSLEA